MGLIQSQTSKNIEIAHHNGPLGSKCQRNHGHSLTVVVNYMYDDQHLDAFGQGPDFGEIKTLIDTYDHQDLNVLLEGPPSMENFAKEIFEQVTTVVGQRPRWVEVTEGGTRNVITYYG